MQTTTASQYITCMENLHTFHVYFFLQCARRICFNMFPSPSITNAHPTATTVHTDIHGGNRFFRDGAVPLCIA